jgi:polysaccharide pyruvyl transferase WcaK-like protein
MARMPLKIGLLDHFGGGNLGDDATQEAVIRNIRSRWPQAEICGFTMNPGDTESRHGIPSYPIRRNTWILGSSPETVDIRAKGRIKEALSQYRGLSRGLRFVYAFVVKKPVAFCAELCFLAKSLRVLRSFAVLIISGGGQLTESWGGPWQFPYTIFKWILLAKATRVKVIVLNVGAGPLTLPLTKALVRTSLSLADYVSFRDANSAQLAEQIGFTGEKVVVSDLVYSLGVPSSFPSSSTKNQRSPAIGIAPMPWGKSDIYPDKDPFVYRSLLAALGGLGSWLLKNQYDIDLFCTDIGVDPPAIADLAQMINEYNPNAFGHIGIPRARTTAELLATMSSVEYVVTCRFHGVVFAHILNKPVIALTHHPKVSTLMSDIGMQEYCLDIRTVDAKRLIDTFRSLIANAPAIKKRMEATRSAYQSRLASQFDRLFAQRSASMGDLTDHRLPKTNIARPDGASVR